MLIADGERELMFFQEQNSIFVSIFLHILSFQIYFSQCHASNLSHISFRPSPRLCHFESFTRSGSTENDVFLSQYSSVLRLRRRQSCISIKKCHPVYESNDFLFLSLSVVPFFFLPHFLPSVSSFGVLEDC